MEKLLELARGRALRPGRARHPAHAPRARLPRGARPAAGRSWTRASCASSCAPTSSRAGSPSRWRRAPGGPRPAPGRPLPRACSSCRTSPSSSWRSRACTMASRSAPPRCTRCCGRAVLGLRAGGGAAAAGARGGALLPPAADGEGHAVRRLRGEPRPPRPRARGAPRRRAAGPSVEPGARRAPGADAARAAGAGPRRAAGGRAARGGHARAAAPGARSSSRTCTTCAGLAAFAERVFARLRRRAARARRGVAVSARLDPLLRQGRGRQDQPLRRHRDPRGASSASARWSSRPTRPTACADALDREVGAEPTADPARPRRGRGGRQPASSRATGARSTST